MTFHKRPPVDKRVWSNLRRVGRVPPVSESLLQKMKKPCPYWEGHRAEGDRPPKIVELAAFFYGSYRMGETDLAHGHSSRCLADGEMSLTSTSAEIVEINYIDWKAGTVAVRV